MSRGHLLAGASALALGVGAGLLLRPRAPRRGRGLRIEPDEAELTRRFLLYFVLPVWLAAGVADWLCHRAAHIEENAGPKESLMHLLMLAEVSLPVTAGLFLEITSPVLAVMIASFLLHDATALWDVSYAVTRREVTPLEQHVHSYLEMMPLMGIAFIAVLHWPQLLGLLRLGGERPDMRIAWKERALPGRYLAAVLGANAVFELLPYLEELWRTLGRPATPRAALAAARQFVAAG